MSDRERELERNLHAAEEALRQIDHPTADANGYIKRIVRAYFAAVQPGGDTEGGA